LEVVARVIAPAAPLWDALLPADRERVANWAQQPKPPKPQPIAGSIGGVRLVGDMQAERRRAMLVRTWRDAGLLVSVALAGAAVALYVRPPMTRLVAGGGMAWLTMVGAWAWYAARCAKGRGIMGTPERNAEYHADPERFALGSVHSFGLGAGLGIAVMLAALAAKAL